MRCKKCNILLGDDGDGVCGRCARWRIEIETAYGHYFIYDTEEGRVIAICTKRSDARLIRDSINGGIDG